MCVAVAVVAGIGVAGSITAAKMQSNAAHDAAATQTAAADKALKLQQTQYQQQRQDFSPYAKAGAGAVGNLQNRSQQPVPQFTPGGPQPQFNLGNPGGQPPPMPQGQSMSGPQSQGAPGSIGAFGMAPQSQPPERMVTLRAPDGSTHPFPQSKVQQVIQQAQMKGDTLQVVG